MSLETCPNCKSGYPTYRPPEGTPCGNCSHPYGEPYEAPKEGPQSSRSLFMAFRGSNEPEALWSISRDAAEKMAIRFGIRYHSVQAWPLHEYRFEELPDVALGYDIHGQPGHFCLKQLLEMRDGKLIPNERGMQLLKS